MLTYYFNRWRLRRATLALVAALGEADLRVQLGSSESQLGEKGVNGIIHNVATVDGRAAEGFRENLVCQDLSVARPQRRLLFSIADGGARPTGPGGGIRGIQCERAKARCGMCRLD